MTENPYDLQIRYNHCTTPCSLQEAGYGRESRPFAKKVVVDDRPLCKDAQVK